jgi:hypothetical protein
LASRLGTVGLAAKVQSETRWISNPAAAAEHVSMIGFTPSRCMPNEARGMSKQKEFDSQMVFYCLRPEMESRLIILRSVTVPFASTIETSPLSGSKGNQKSSHVSRSQNITMSTCD